MRHSYADTTAILGHMIEVVEDKETIRAIFAIVKQTHETWDKNKTWDKNRETLVQELDSH